jgi:hypothetical protein
VVHADHHLCGRDLSWSNWLTNGRRSSITSALTLKPEALEKYEQYLGNHHCCEKGLRRASRSPGHLHNHEALHDPNIKEYEIALDPVNADPTNPRWIGRISGRAATDKIATIEKKTCNTPTCLCRRHSAYFATYFTITGLHGAARARRRARVHLYVAAGEQANLYQRNPEHLANRVEVSRLFWHFVDLVWIFVFPLFYLL